MPWPTHAQRKESRRRAEEAAAAIAAREPTLPPADELARVTWLLTSAPWTFARTMAHNPHHYTLRNRWENADDFVLVVEFIRRYGDVERFPDPATGWPYIVLRLGEYKYWSMGEEIDQTTLINRKPKDVP
jgi:hypothetical protein